MSVNRGFYSIILCIIYISQKKTQLPMYMISWYYKTADKILSHVPFAIKKVENWIEIKNFKVRYSVVNPPPQTSKIHFFRWVMNPSLQDMYNLVGSSSAVATSTLTYTVTWDIWLEAWLTFIYILEWLSALPQHNPECILSMI